MNKNEIESISNTVQLRTACDTTWFVESKDDEKRMGTINYPGNGGMYVGKNYHAILEGATRNDAGPHLDLGHFEDKYEAADAISAVWFRRQHAHEVLDSIDPSWGD